MKTPFVTYAVTAVLLSAVGAFRCGAATSSFFDNFDSGTDSGWTHLDPLAPFGAPATFSFPNGGYRVQASASPDAANLGPGRAGSLRTDVNFPGLYEFSELVAWNNTLNQSIGLLGRVTSPGFGTTKGYAFTYSTAGSINLSLIANDKLTTLASVPLTLDPTKSYGLEFDCIGTSLLGLVYQQGSGNSFAFVGAQDSTYAAGGTGFYLFSNVGNGTADATFDNYKALLNPIPEPRIATFLSLGVAVLLLVAIRRHKENESLRRRAN